MSKLAEARAFVRAVEELVKVDEFEGLITMAATGTMEFDDDDPAAWENRRTGGL